MVAVDDVMSGEGVKVAEVVMKRSESSIRPEIENLLARAEYKQICPALPVTEMTRGFRPRWKVIENSTITRPQKQSAIYSGCWEKGRNGRPSRHVRHRDELSMPCSRLTYSLAKRSGAGLSNQ